MLRLSRRTLSSHLAASFQVGRFKATRTFAFRLPVSPYNLIAPHQIVPLRFLSSSSKDATPTKSHPRRLSSIGDFKRLFGCCMELSKVRLSNLVVFSSSAGFLMAGSPIEAGPLLAVSAGTTLCAWSANTFNQC